MTKADAAMVDLMTRVNILEKELAKTGLSLKRTYDKGLKKNFYAVFNANGEQLRGWVILAKIERWAYDR